MAVASVAYHAAPLPYQVAPVHYSSARAVSYPSIQRHDKPHAIAAAPVVHYAAAPVAHYSTHQEVDTHPRNDFSYSVHDEHIGDNKSQYESHDGDAVHGEYSQLEAHGSVRTVQYTADVHNGFNTVVSHFAPSSHHKNC